MIADERWDAKYADRDEPRVPSDLVIEHVELLGDSSTAVDLVGGTDGTDGTALWLAEQGIATTLVDVSGRALEIARVAAADRCLPMQTVQADLEAEPLPTAAELGSERGCDVVVCANFLHRTLRARHRGVASRRVVGNGDLADTASP
ncbi:class I SAM-dependent methyltransferase [Candidatus Poriferisodalis sp.]|uniref:class I SAM-dependent methyltransferase n=1 Tax=Candidatus Poriferisodalis sp. TaxID=3101277 RepID=UPI003B0137C7